MTIADRPGAVLFDLDGVLVRSETVHSAAYSSLFAEEGLDFTVDNFRSLGRGVSRRDVIRRVLGSDLDPERLQELMQRKEELVCGILERGELAPVSGALEFLRELERAEIPRAVASVSQMPHAFLDGINVSERFEIVLGGDDVPRTKPAPDVYLEAARRLAVPADECVVIEDSVTGIRAGRAAGMTVIGLTTTAQASALTEADVVCCDYQEIRSHLGFCKGQSRRT